MRERDGTTFLLCMACGRLDDPTAAGPYRADPRQAALATCSHCEQPELVDLSVPETMIVLTEEVERGRLQRRPLGPRLVRRVIVISASLVALVFATILLVQLAIDPGKGYQVGALLAAVVAVLFGIPGVAMMARMLRRQWALTRARSLPARWRLRLPAAHPPPSAIEAPVICEAPLLCAPISGRPCVAYELGVREDNDGAAPLGTWLLLEQRSAALRVGEHALTDDAAFLDLKRRPLLWPPPDSQRARADRLLRARGFSPNGAKELCIFESVIEVGETVTLVDSAPPILSDRGRRAALASRY